MDTTTNVWDRLLHHIKLFLEITIVTREYGWFLGKKAGQKQLKLERPWKRRFVLGGSTDK